MRGARHNRGFTLLELILVLFVLVLVAAISYPSLSRGTAAFYLRGTGRDVLNTLRFAREKAITEQTAMTVLADRQAGKVVLATELGDGAREYSLPGDVRIRRLVTGGAEVLEGPLVIRFLPNGSCDDAAIELESSTGGRVLIVTDPITGGARILEQEKEGRP